MPIYEEKPYIYNQNMLLQKKAMVHKELHYFKTSIQSAKSSASADGQIRSHIKQCSTQKVSEDSL